MPFVAKGYLGAGVLGLLCGVSVACLPAQPRLGYPWIESRDAELRRERLEVALRGDHAQVYVRFVFVGHRAGAALPLAFPEDQRDPPLEDYRLWVDGLEVATRRVVGGASQGYLPLTHVGRWHEGHGGRLGRGQRRVVEVRYRQRLVRVGGGLRFRYLLRTGAYWRGPIGELVARVELGRRRLRSAILDGRRGVERARAVGWRVKRFEPRGDILLLLEEESG